jgi:hypothetical protein
VLNIHWDSQHYGTAEASDLRDLGFTPGVWPPYFKVGFVTFYRRTLHRDTENEVVSVQYADDRNRFITIYND